MLLESLSKWLLFVGLGAAAACSTSPSSNDGEPRVMEAGDPMFACSVDADCVLVDLGPCDICNGGEQISVHAGHADQALAKYGREQGGACSAMGCQWSPAPTCDAGVCARLLDLDADPATPPTKVVNFSRQ